MPAIKTKNMYTRIKNITLNIIPKSILFRYEYMIRFVYYLFYIGSRFRCNICERKLSGFIQLKNDLICPRCGSIQRARRLWQLLNDGFLKKDMIILDFSPSRSLYRIMKKGDYIYESTDLSGDFLSDKSYDIKNIDSKSEKYDLIICYHVLEHIDDDTKAMRELFRILKKGGNAIIQTPFKEGDIYEDDSITTPEEREKYFGQSDHVRIYSIGGLKNRLETVGFNVNIKIFQENNITHGFNQNEAVLICYKPE
jgi:SAM-dependent methyltransferase